MRAVFRLYREPRRVQHLTSPTHYLEGEALPSRVPIARPIDNTRLGKPRPPIACCVERSARFLPSQRDKDFGDFAGGQRKSEGVFFDGT